MFPGESGDTGWIGFSVVLQVRTGCPRIKPKLFPKFKESVRVSTRLPFIGLPTGRYPDKTKARKTFHASVIESLVRGRKGSRSFKRLQKMIWRGPASNLPDVRVRLSCATN